MGNDIRGYTLAVDIGASSGRHILGHIENGRMETEEIYRFENGMKNVDGKLLWDTGHLFDEIVNGMAKCKEIGKIPDSVAIDTWAVDYVLLDENDDVLGDTYGYRDGRTAGMDEKVYETIPLKKLYARTGIQKQIFNTIYQLMAVKQQTPELLEKAKTFIMLPDYFGFLLTGHKKSEYTNASSTQLVNPKTKQWDMELIRMLGYPAEIFMPLTMPGTLVGGLKEDIKSRIGYDCKVVQCASHDTASAVMAMPVTSGQGKAIADDSLYISSGTWSLMGVELGDALCDEKSMNANFTNEGGYDYRFRYLKNIMGLWMIQSVRHELNDAYSFAQLCDMAKEAKDFPSRVDVNDDSFLAPKNMTEAIKEYCRKKGEKVPESIGQLCTVIYQSLADCYGQTVREIEQNTGRKFESIHIIGGGANAEYLNQLTANATQKTVYAGPGEATAIGNLAAQMIAGGELKDLGEARQCIFDSFDVKTYKPV